MTAHPDTGLPPRIYLTGFMGSGKSTVAPELAGLLGYASIDLDRAIEAAAGRSVTEIFSELGEGEFRRLEREALLATAALERVVVAAGGGAITDDAAIGLVRSGGVLVYLRVDAATLVGRLRSKGDRPLLAGQARPGGGTVELERRVVALLSEREPWYRLADIILDPDPADPSGTARMIAGALRARPPRPAT